MHKIGLILVFGALFCACHREEVMPLQDSSTPIFKAEIKVNGDTVSGNTVDLYAGVSGTTMETSLENIQGVTWSNSILQNAQNKLTLSLSNGNMGTDFSYRERLAFNGKMPIFDADSFNVSFPVSQIADLVGENVSFQLDGQAVDNQISITQPGIYQLQGIAQRQGQTYTITNDWFVGYKNNYGYLDFSYDSTNHSLAAQIVNATAPKTAIKWFLDGTLVGETTLFHTIENYSGYKVLRAEVTYKDRTCSYEALVDFDNTGGEAQDIRKVTPNIPNTADFALKMTLERNGETWKILPKNGQPILLLKAAYFNAIEGKEIYSVEGKTTPIILKNVTTQEVHEGTLKLIGGFQFDD